MTFTVYAELAQEVSKKLDRLAKKADAYGIQFSYSTGAEHPQLVRVMGVDPVTQTQAEVSRHTVAAVNFEVECDGLIRANGWTVRAKVEHGDKGNIVTVFGGYKANPAWYTAAPNCDHCQTNRYRGVTFFVEHEDGSVRQVGRTCLKEYTGISPATAAMWAEVQDLVDRGVDCTREEWDAWHPAPMYEVLGILAHAADEVREFGYRRSSEPDSTRDRVLGRVLSGEQPSEAGLAEAREVMDWLTAMEPDDASDLERNCITLALSGYAKRNHIGMLAYMPVGHRRKIERQAQQEAAVARSEYVGEVGQRITLKAATVALLSSWDGYYGTTWLYKFVDESGNVFIWKSSRPFTAEDGATIRATVKDHNERDGVKQTIVTRCCLAA
ncbi:hypothetical protein [Faecalibaculum rodentium]|jgi:hypothetical protein|uniref:hypothetical protein n=1 Tax=Faecalibaculum rodentium TaxID=1702221 RepID=UPI0026F389A5|nr:hypothetical protein [Faecalibaculum rodentium]